MRFCCPPTARGLLLWLFAGLLITLMVIQHALGMYEIYPSGTTPFPVTKQVQPLHHVVTLPQNLEAIDPGFNPGFGAIVLPQSCLKSGRCSLESSLPPDFSLEATNPSGLLPYKVEQRKIFQPIDPYFQLQLARAQTLGFLQIILLPESQENPLAGGEPMLKGTSLMLRENPSDYAFPAPVSRLIPGIIVEEDRLTPAWFRELKDKNNWLFDHFKANQTNPRAERIELIIIGSDLSSESLRGLTESFSQLTPLLPGNVQNTLYQLEQERALSPMLCTGYCRTVYRMIHGVMTLSFEVLTPEGWQTASGELYQRLQGLWFEEELFRAFGEDYSGPFGYSGAHSRALSDTMRRIRESEAKEWQSAPQDGGGSNLPSSTSIRSSSVSRSISSTPAVTPSLQITPSTPTPTLTPTPSNPPEFEAAKRTTDNTQSATSGQTNQTGLQLIETLRNRLKLSNETYFQWLSLLAQKEVNSSNQSSELNNLNLRSRLQMRWVLPALALVFDDLDELKQTFKTEIGAGPVEHFPTAYESTFEENSIQRVGWTWLTIKEPKSATMYDLMSVLRDSGGFSKTAKTYQTYASSYNTHESDTDYHLLRLAMGDLMLGNIVDHDAVGIISSQILFSINRPWFDNPPMIGAGSPGQPEEPHSSELENEDEEGPWPPSDFAWSSLSSDFQKVDRWLRILHSINQEERIKSLRDSMTSIVKELGFQPASEITLRGNSACLEVTRDSHRYELVLRTFRLSELKKYQSTQTRLEQLEVDPHKPALAPIHHQLTQSLPDIHLGAYFQLLETTAPIILAGTSLQPTWLVVQEFVQSLHSFFQQGYTITGMEPEHLRRWQDRWVLAGLGPEIQASTTVARVMDSAFQEATLAVTTHFLGQSPLSLFAQRKKLTSDDAAVVALMSGSVSRKEAFTHYLTAEFNKAIQIAPEGMLRNLATLSTSSATLLDADFTLMGQLVQASKEGTASSYIQLLETGITSSYQTTPAIEPLAITEEAPPSLAFAEPVFNPGKMGEKMISDILKRAGLKILQNLQKQCSRFEGSISIKVTWNNKGHLQYKVFDGVCDDPQTCLVTNIQCTAESVQPYLQVVNYFKQRMQGVTEDTWISHSFFVPMFDAQGQDNPYFRKLLNIWMPNIDERVQRLHRQWVRRIAPAHKEKMITNSKLHLGIMFEPGGRVALGSKPVEYDKLDTYRHNPGRPIDSIPKERGWFAAYARRVLRAPHKNASHLSGTAAELYEAAARIQGHGDDDLSFFQLLLAIDAPPDDPDQQELYYQQLEDAKSQILDTTTSQAPQQKHQQ